MLLLWHGSCEATKDVFTKDKNAAIIQHDVTASFIPSAWGKSHDVIEVDIQRVSLLARVPLIFPATKFENLHAFFEPAPF